MSETIATIVAVCLTFGAGAVFVFGGYVTPRQSSRTVLHGLVCLIAATFYVVLASGHDTVHLGSLEIDTHHALWLLTTPLLLAALLVTASPVGNTLLPLALTALFLDVVIVLARAVAVDQDGGAVWIWFLVSLVATGFLFLVLWQPVREVAETGHPVRAELYDRHARILMVLWCLWPAVFFLGPDFQGLYGSAWQTGLYGAVDLAVMIGYGLLVVLEDDRLIPVEEEEGRMQPAESDDEPAPVRETGPTLRVPPPTGRALARERLLDLYYRGGDHARIAAGRARVASGIDRHASPPPPAAEQPRRRRKPGLVTSLKMSATQTPFGRLTREDAVPVAIVAAALLVIAHASGRPKGRR